MTTENSDGRQSMFAQQHGLLKQASQQQPKRPARTLVKKDSKEKAARAKLKARAQRLTEELVKQFDQRQRNK